MPLLLRQVTGQNGRQVTSKSNCSILKHYSLCQKKRTFKSEFFRGPPWGGGPKIRMVDHVTGSSTHAQFFSLKNLQPFGRYFTEHGSMSQN